MKELYLYTCVVAFGISFCISLHPSNTHVLIFSNYFQFLVSEGRDADLRGKIDKLHSKAKDDERTISVYNEKTGKSFLAKVYCLN